MATSYRIIGYGESDYYGFFNQFNFASTYESAMVDFRNLLANPEMDGAVLIEVNHEDWAILEEFDSGYPVSVVFTEVGTFRVDKSPELVLV
jgi:hypothetical protein